MKNKQINERLLLLLLLLQIGEATNESRIRIPMSKYKSPAEPATLPCPAATHTFAFLGEWALGRCRREGEGRLKKLADSPGARKLVCCTETKALPLFM